MRKDKAKVKMNVAAYQEKEKTGKKEAKEERKQSTDFKEAASCPSWSFRGRHSKKMVCVREVAVVTTTLGRPTAISTQSKRGRGPHHHIEAAVDWCICKLSRVVTNIKL